MLIPYAKVQTSGEDIWLRHEEGEQTRGYQRYSPDQVEVEPRRTKNDQAEFAIDHPRQQASDGKISCGMDRSGEQCRERAGDDKRVMVA